MGLRWHGTAAEESVAAIDPARLARWWAQVLKVRLVSENPDVVAIPGLTFVRSEQAQSNRLAVKLDSDDLTADVEKLLDMGARHIEVGEGIATPVVLADPEGNEFRIQPSIKD